MVAQYHRTSSQSAVPATRRDVHRQRPILPLTRSRDLGVHDRTLQVATIVYENRIWTKLVRKMTDHHLVYDAHWEAHWQDGIPSGPGHVDDQLPDLATSRGVARGSDSTWRQGGCSGSAGDSGPGMQGRVAYDYGRPSPGTAIEVTFSVIA